MHLSRTATAGAAATTCLAAVLLLPSPALASDSYPPPAFGGGGGTFSTTFEPPAVQPVPASLPATGRDLRALLATGAASVGTGALALVLARRRRSA